MTYSEDVALELLKLIREGSTLKQICEYEGMPERLEVYDWLKSNEFKVGKQTFGKMYSDALKDRTLSWQDDAFEVFDDVPLTGRKTDSAELKRRWDKANLLIRLAKEQRESLKATGGGSSAPTVIVRRFGD